jgi:hypothetical protein
MTDKSQASDMTKTEPRMSQRAPMGLACPEDTGKNSPMNPHAAMTAKGNLLDDG